MPRGKWFWVSLQKSSPNSKYFFLNRLPTKLFIQVQFVYVQIYIIFFCTYPHIILEPMIHFHTFLLLESSLASDALVSKLLRYKKDFSVCLSVFKLFFSLHALNFIKIGQLSRNFNMVLGYSALYFYTQHYTQHFTF